MLAYTEDILIQNQARTQAAAAAEQRWRIITSSVPTRRVKLVEEVYVVLGDVGEGDPKRWIFNMGASNHMIGVKEVLIDLDIRVVSTVCFRDGFIVQIKGYDTILFACKNGEHQTLINTYYIPRLIANIVSYGQLDEWGSRFSSKVGSCGSVMSRCGCCRRFIAVSGSCTCLTSP
jgi:hypothetical protein